MKSRPLGVTLIGYFSIWSSIVLLFVLFEKQDIEMNVRFAVPFIPEIIFRIILIIFTLIMAFGYLDLKKWGFWAVVIYSFLFLLISINQYEIYRIELFKINAIYSAIVLIYTLLKIKVLYLKYR